MGAGADAASAPSYADIAAFLQQHPNPIPDKRTRLLSLLTEFIAANENPHQSPNFKSQVPDRLDGLCRTMRDTNVIGDESLSLAFLKTLKILSRKHENRMSLGAAGVDAVVRVLHNPRNSAIAGEASNVVLNVCYEKENVEEVLKCNGVPALVSFLRSTETDLQANAAGAIQSICFQESGRAVVRDGGAIQDILRLLGAEYHLKVQTRAVGAIHNMSSDADSIRIIRRKEGIPRLVELLASDQAAVCGSAAGALQNISREVASRKIIKDHGAIPLLGDLLVTGELQAQVCAAGALLNIIGPELGDGGGGPGSPGGDLAAAGPNRKGFCKILSSCLTLSMAYDLLFDQPPPVPVV